MNPQVTPFFNNAKKWKQEMQQLRMILLETGLTEELKWGVPCYTLDQKNVVLIHAFKDYCALLFHKGALLKDQEQILIQQTKNVQAARQIRFTSLEQIIDMEPVIKSYVHEALAVEKAGLQVEMKKTAEFDMPEEFKVRLDQNPELKSAFEALSPGRQRGYLLFFTSAKQSKTREARIEKWIPGILKGKGLKD